MVPQQTLAQLEEVQKDYALKHGLMMQQMVDESVAMELRENLQQLELSALESRLELEVRVTYPATEWLVCIPIHVSFVNFHSHRVV